MLTEEPSLAGSRRGPPPKKNNRTMDHNYQQLSDNINVNASYPAHQGYLKNIQQRNQGQQQQQSWQKKGSLHAAGSERMIIKGQKVGAGPGMPEYTNADLPEEGAMGDAIVQNIMYQGKRTSTIEMAQSPEHQSWPAKVAGSTVSGVVSSSHQPAAASSSLNATSVRTNQMDTGQQQQSLSNQYYTENGDSRGGRRPAQDKMSANRSSSSSRRFYQQQRLRQSNNRQAANIQGIRQSAPTTQTQVDVSRLTKNDMRAALERYNQLQPADGQEQPMYMGGTKTVELWQDFQKMLANQMLGERLGQQSAGGRSNKTSPGKYSQKPPKQQSPVKSNMSRSRERQYQTNSYHQSNGGQELSSQSIQNLKDSEAAQGLNSNISLFQQGIQDAIIRHHNEQQYRTLKPKKANRRSPNKNRSQKRSKKVQSDNSSNQQKIMYKNAVKDLIKDEGGPRGNVVDPYKFYQQQRQMSPQLHENLRQQRIQVETQAYLENLQQHPLAPQHMNHVSMNQIQMMTPYTQQQQQQQQQQNMDSGAYVDVTNNQVYRSSQQSSALNQYQNTEVRVTQQSSKMNKYTVGTGGNSINGDARQSSHAYVNTEARLSSNADSAVQVALVNTSDFRRTTATFPTVPDRASIEAINQNYQLRNSDHMQNADRSSNTVGGYQRISVAKLADLENEMAQQIYRDQHNGTAQLDNILNTPPIVLSEQPVQAQTAGIAGIGAIGDFSSSSRKNTDGAAAYVPISFCNTNLNSRHQSKDVAAIQYEEHVLNGSKGIQNLTQNHWQSRDTDENTKLNVELLQPKDTIEELDENDSQDAVKKITLPSYRDDRNVRPTQVVRDFSNSQQSSKATSNTLTKRMNDTLQKRSEDLQMIPSDRAEEATVDQQIMDNQYRQNLLNQIKKNQAQQLEQQQAAQLSQQYQGVVGMENQWQSDNSNLPPMSQNTTKTLKYKKMKKPNAVLDQSTEENGFKYGLVQNIEKDMFNVDQFGKVDDSSLLLMAGVGPNGKSAQRKRSPEELIDTVNRKYGVLFGQGKPLVGIHNDLKQLETEDFMKYLTSNERPRRSKSNRANSQKSDLSPNQRGVQLIGNSKSQINLQITKNQASADQQLNRFVEFSLRKRSRSQKRQFSASRKSVRSNGRIRAHRMLSNKHQSVIMAQKRVKFKNIQEKFAQNRASSNKSLNNYKTFFRNYSELRTADDSHYNSRVNRKNYQQYRSTSRLPGNYNKALICLTPSLRRKDQLGGNVSANRNKRLNLSKSLIENEWDRDEISKLKYQEYVNEKNRIKQKRDPWAPKQQQQQAQQQQQSPLKMKKSNSQRNLSEEKHHLDDQYKKVVLDIWKEVKLQNKQTLIALKRPDRFDGETQASIQKKAQNQMARIRAIQAKLKPFVFQRFSDFYQINKNMSSEIEVQKRIQALNLNEQILHKIDFDLLQVDIEIIRLRLLNAYMLLKTYQQAGDDLRVIRFMQESTSKNLYLPSLLKKLSQQGDLGELDLQNYVLFIYQLYAESLIRKGYNEEAKNIFYDICKVYNRWKINNRTLQDISDLDPNNDRIFEFGIDDYIKAKASYAESIMNCGQIDHAIDKFENTKNQIENEIIYENPMIYVNVCNQLGNCYLLKMNSERALQNFEISLNMISNIEAEKQVEINLQGDQYQVDRVSPLVVAKICLNIAILRSQMGNHDEAVYMHEKSLLYKSRVLPQLHDEIRDQNILLAFAQQRANMAEQACASLTRALAIHKSHNGEQNYKAAQLFCQLATAYLKTVQVQDAIENFEHACMILLKLEQASAMGASTNQQQQELNKSTAQTNDNGKSASADKTTSKLDKTYLQLLDLYMQSNQAQQANQIMQTLEARLESISNTDEYAYRMMNEMANLLQKHQLHDKSIMFYKKALLCMKRRHKNRFNQQPETAKILINIASVLYVTDNVRESLKSFMHALEVLSKVASTFEQFEGDMTPFRQLYVDALVEKGKVHMTCANILRSIGGGEQATMHYNRAIENFEMCCQQINDQAEEAVGGLSPANEMEMKNIKLLMLEARTCLKSF